MARSILHLDLDAFFCAVEEQLHPELYGKAFAVGARPDQRGVVASCSYPARRYGVHSAMPMAEAVRLCPDLLIVPHSFGAYRAHSEQVMAILNDLTPLVEQVSIDEAFLDVTGLKQDGPTIARTLQQTINERLGLPCSLGVASNKLIAKIANNRGKARIRTGSAPNAIEVVPPGEEAAYLAPLPVSELWGVGDKTAARLQSLGIRTIGELAQQPHRRLVQLFGKHGYAMWRHAQGIDERPVETEHAVKSISKETTFAHDIRDEATLRRTLRQLSEQVGRRLRQQELRGSTVKLKLRRSDFTTLSRQLTLTDATDNDEIISEAVQRLFSQLWATEPVRLIGVGVSNLTEGQRQLSLFEDQGEKRSRKLQGTIDDLRERFGDQTIQRGSDLKPDS